ncbi:MAG: glutamate 5-kinase [Akkermansiaceae bacterium]|nr:glutamate 5-kinase [Akkermansiaceae bacterium]NNM29543.1 glutamate 5-kinase [Akkermansiaceae bacterium]
MDAPQRIVIKIGTGVLTKEDGTLDSASLARLVAAVADLQAEDRHIVLVSSGAVGAGISALGLKEYPEDLPTRQAAAAIGQTRLMHAYENLFRSFETGVAQLLLTAGDLDSPERRARVSDTLQRLLAEDGIIPIINENDSVAVEELAVGDNDVLSARVAVLLGARLLVLLTSVDGLYPPGGGEIVKEVREVDEVLFFADGEKGKFSIGGMETKLQAVKLAVDAGVETVIANGRKPERLAGIVTDGGDATRFRASR